MSSDFQELDYQQTPLGELILRKRRSLSTGELVYEVKLDGAFLMSSLINEAEKALATLTLRQLAGQPCDVLVGGLGLGHTAEATLSFDHVRHLDVVEYLEPVVDWHRRRLVPAADALMGDPRCRLMHDDFFDLVVGREATVFRRYEAILLDIDHSPESVLHPRHAAFYTVPGLTRLTTHLKPPGLFALWSADRPEDTFLRALREVFVCVEAHDVRFFNHHLGEHDSNWIIIARFSDGPGGQGESA